MIKKYIRIAELLHKQQTGATLSPEEIQELQEWESASPGNKRIAHEIQERKWNSRTYNEYFQAGDSRRSWEKVVHQSGWQAPHPLLKFRLIRYAALLILFLGAGSMWMFLRPTRTTILPDTAEVIHPGQVQAILTLSNGQSIRLENNRTDSSILEKNGILIRNQGKNLHYISNSGSNQDLRNTIQVPRGGEYQLILADGSKVWLNAETRLTYPVTFNGNSRELQLEGEAYFEVAKDPERPFIVHTSQFDVRVTGTEFNVRTYPEDDRTATLIEGKVQIEEQANIHQLSPGQQIRFVNNRAEIRTIDTEEIIAWRNAAFYFRQRQLESILNELARWYDFTVFYQTPEVKDYHFTAWFSRTDSIATVIQMLEKTNKIKIQRNGKTLIVGKNE